ncbi:MAG: DUF4136 domain-containing protein [Candidatus Korobacteraceae bacterium]
MNRALRSGVVIAFLIAGVVAADDRQVDFDEQMDFAKFTTFSVGQGRITSNKPELSGSIVRERIEAAIRRELSAKGLREVPGQSDLVVMYGLGAANKADVQTWVGPRGRRRATSVNRFTEGTLVIDLRQRSSRELVWRGIYRDDEKDAGRIARKLDEDVKKLFEKYPPKK